MTPVTLEWVQIAEGDWSTANRENLVTVDTNFRAVSYHSQQCGEKYLKAFLQESGLKPDRTHDLTFLLGKILPVEPTFAPLQKACVELTLFAVDIRYPGTTSSAQEAVDALVYAAEIRRAIRQSLGLSVT